MKAWPVLLSIACITLAQSACQFDRGALYRKPTSPSGVDAGTDASTVSVIDSAVDSGRDAEATRDATTLDAGSGTVGPVTMHDPDPNMDMDSGFPIDPPGPPMTGGLQCDGMFCPFAVDPAKPCCTRQVDVDARTARSVGRCGLDLTALQSTAYHDSCWQRDQLGIVDDSCPDAPAEESGGAIEPGCCADDGQCGTVNASQKLGCHHPLGSTKQTCGILPGGNSCDPTGNFAVKVTADATWGGRSGGLWALTDDGRGKIDVYLLLTVTGVDPTTRELSIHGRVCGVTFPPFYSSTLCETYQPIFPDTIWEAPDVPKLPLTGRYECTGGSCVMSVDPYTYLLGFEMANREAPWPPASDTTSLTCPSGDGAACFPDQDDDSRAGVTVILPTTGKVKSTTSSCMQGGYAQRAAPLSASPAAIFNGVRRTDRMMLGARMKVGASVRLGMDCQVARGSALAEYVNSRAYGCLVQPGTLDFPSQVGAGKNDPCKAAEATFLDENLPVYNLLAAGTKPDSSLTLADTTASHGPQSSSIRLGSADAAFSCSDVRKSMF